MLCVCLTSSKTFDVVDGVTNELVFSPTKLKYSGANNAHRGGPPEGTNNNYDIPDVWTCVRCNYIHERQRRDDQNDVG